MGNTITIGVEEYKELLTAKIKIELVEKKLTGSADRYVSREDILDYLGIEESEGDE